MTKILLDDNFENSIRKDIRILLQNMLHDFGTKIRHPLSSYPVDNFGTVVGENPDCLLLSGTVVGENPDHVCWVIMRELKPTVGLFST